MNQSQKTMKMVMAGVLTAVILVLAFVPGLGYIPLGIINATIIHVPVIIGAILLGPKYGAYFGLVFGLTSLFKNTTSPNLTSFVFSPFYSVGEFSGNFSSLIICLVPRILIGVVAYYVFTLMMSVFQKLAAGKGKHVAQVVSLAVAGVAGSLTNTLLVMNMIYLFFGSEYAAATGKAYDTLYGAILAIIVGSGVPEAIVAGVLTCLITKVLFQVVRVNGIRK